MSIIVCYFSNLLWAGFELGFNFRIPIQIRIALQPLEQCGPKMRHKKRGVGILRTPIYGLVICLPLLLLTSSQARAQSSEAPVTERDLNDCKLLHC